MSTDLLRSVLATCGAEMYTDNFKNNGIDLFTLKILSNEDLQIIGIPDEDMRCRIIENVANLQIPAEQNIETVVSSQYTRLLLSHTSIQLHKHFANLAYALIRDDVDLCNINLTPAVNHLQLCLKSLERQLECFNKK
ncbi:hypothetical protein NQ318_008181, partial [Aromia moschata]